MKEMNVIDEGLSNGLLDVVLNELTNSVNSVDPCQVTTLAQIDASDTLKSAKAHHWTNLIKPRNSHDRWSMTEVRDCGTPDLTETSLARGQDTDLTETSLDRGQDIDGRDPSVLTETSLARGQDTNGPGPSVLIKSDKHNTHTHTALLLAQAHLANSGLGPYTS
ncbi:unnamed protein product [Lupinus luteus]|uniref:Uncharacterized protein n=1 Tax=Lupinus luteus TaxID=3873 RepID=A0AAV1Y6Y7_LUPLU